MTAVRRIDLRVDVTGSVAIDGRLETAVSVFASDLVPVGGQPIVLFGFPGGRFARGYYSIEWPGLSGYSQAEYHASRGMVVVSCDHLGVGDSTIPDLDLLTLDNLAAANAATVREVTARLEADELVDGFSTYGPPVAIGIGQSMGGALLIVQQAWHRSFDAIAVLGYSPIHTVPPRPAGSPTDHVPRPPRGSDPRRAMASVRETPPPPRASGVGSWHHHWDDVPDQLVEADSVRAPLPPWASATIPSCAPTLLARGCVAEEAARVDVPVFIGVGTRDVCVRPHEEPSAYLTATDITFRSFPRMAHMHNFAGTRHLLWAAIDRWARSVAEDASDNTHGVSP